MARSAPWVILLVSMTNACAPAVLYFGRSPDRRHTVRVVEVASKQYVELDGVGEVGYRAVGVEGLVFSDDGAHLAFPALTERGWIVVRDGVKSADRWDGIGEVVFSDDGRHLAYAGERKGTWHVVQDGVIGPGWLGIERGSLIFRSKLAYVAQDRHGWRAVVDGRAGAAFDAIEALQLSEDGFAFVGVRGAKAAVVVDGVEGERFEAIARLRLRIRRVAYAAKRDGAWFVVDGATMTGPFEVVSALCWAGSRLVYVADRVDTSQLICAGDTSAWVVRRLEGGEQVVIDDVPQAIYPSIKALSLSDDGQHHVYAAGQIVVHDGRETVIEKDQIVELAISKDGLHWAALTAEVGAKQLWLVVDGTRRAPFDLEELVAHGLQRQTKIDRAALRKWLAAELVTP